MLASFRLGDALSYSFLRQLATTRRQAVSQAQIEHTTVANVGRLIASGEGPDPLLLLGAGASVMSGVPGAEELATMAVKWAYCREHGHVQHDPHVKRSDWLPWLGHHEWFQPQHSLGEQYPQVIERLLRPRDNRRDFFLDALKPRLAPSAGYQALGELAVAGLILTVLTTNFDPLIPEALRTRPELRTVNLIESPSDIELLSTAPDYPQVVFLHGSVRHYSDKNVEHETQRLQVGLRDALRPLLRDHPLIVIGYRGAEPSVMVDLLLNGAEDAQGYRRGIYWCARPQDIEQLHPLVHQLAVRLGSNFQLVPIDRFDESMTSWSTMAAGEGRHARASSKSRSRPPVADMQAADCELDDMDWHLLADNLTEYANRLSFAVSRDDRQALAGRMCTLDLAAPTENGIRPTRAGQLLFGRGPVSHVEVRYEGAVTPVRGNLFVLLDRLSAMVDEVNVPFRLKGSTSQTVRPFAPEAVKEVLVNALVHRDHTAEAPTRLSLSRHELSVTSPGGLVSTLDVERLGQPGHKAYRNPVLADVFYGTGAMDKAGSGLADARRWSRDAGGDAHFGPNDDNTKFVAALRGRVQQPNPETGTADGGPVERFLTNLLSVRIEARYVNAAACALRYRDIEQRHPDGELPAFFLYEGRLWTFSDLADPANPLSREVYGATEQVSVEELLTDADRERLLVQLLNRTMLNHARRRGLCAHRSSQRLWFPRSADGKRLVTYQARVREARRTVTKPLSSAGDRQSSRWEHESLRFSFRRYGNRWALHLVPGWVFTHDGRKQLMRGRKVARIATRRSARDFNPQVANDLYFWLWVLTGGDELAALDPDRAIVLESSLHATEVFDAPTPVGARFAALAEAAGESAEEFPDELADVNDEEAA